MYNIDMEFVKGIFVVRLSGNFNKRACTILEEDLNQLITTNGIKFLLINLNDISSIDNKAVEIIFENYPELKKAYDLAMELTDIYNARSIKDAARLKLARWFNKVEKLGVDNFYTVIDTFKNHYDTILNFFVNRATNANAESFNAKVKAFRAQFRGVTDIPFFLYRLMKLCA